MKFKTVYQQHFALAESPTRHAYCLTIDACIERGLVMLYLKEKLGRTWNQVPVFASADHDSKVVEKLERSLGGMQKQLFSLGYISCDDSPWFMGVESLRAELAAAHHASINNTRLLPPRLLIKLVGQSIRVYSMDGREVSVSIQREGSDPVQAEVLPVEASILR